MPVVEHRDQKFLSSNCKETFYIFRDKDAGAEKAMATFDSFSPGILHLMGISALIFLVLILSKSHALLSFWLRLWIFSSCLDT